MPARFPVKTVSAFTLVELLTVVAIIAALTIAAMIAYTSVAGWAQQTADRQACTILNDTLTRYKTEGGGTAALTLGAPIGHIITAMQTPVTWCGQSHQFLQNGVTYPGRSLQAVGSGAQYHFYRYNTYSGETVAAGTPTSQYPYGQGVGYVSNGNNAGGYPSLFVSPTSGCVAVKSATGTITVYNSAGWIPTLAQSPSYTFWSCIGPAGAGNGSNSVMSGNVTQVKAQGNWLTALNISGLISVTSITLSESSLTALDLSTLTALQIFNSPGSGLLSMDFSKCTLLTTLTIEAAPLTYLNCNGLSHLTSLYCDHCFITTPNFIGCTALTMLDCDANNGVGGLTTTKATLEALYQSLPPVTSATLKVGSAASGFGSNTALVPSGWTVSFTP